ncbi:MAG: carboxypeptidase-like regulatory domain-containing protein, partial [Bryobacteraceae bacterium]
MRGRNLSLVCFFLMAANAFGQGGNATITGTVVDASDAIVAGAQIRVTNVQTGVVKATRVTNSGLYVVPDVIPGTYNVEISADGFQAKRFTDVRLAVGQQAKIDVKLEVGSSKQVVDVVGTEVPLLQTVEASV